MHDRTWQAGNVSGLVVKPRPSHSSAPDPAHDRVSPLLGDIEIYTRRRRPRVILVTSYEP